MVYVGDSRSREAIRAFEFDADRRPRAASGGGAAWDPSATGVAGAAASSPAPGSSPREHRFEVIITTYELILKDAPILNKIE